MQNNKMCKKTVYWDLINSDMNKRDVQTGCSGVCTPVLILTADFNLVLVVVF